MCVHARSRLLFIYDVYVQMDVESESKVCVLCVQPPQQFYTLHSAACAGVWRSIKDTQIQNALLLGGVSRLASLSHAVYFRTPSQPLCIGASSNQTLLLRRLGVCVLII